MKRLTRIRENRWGHMVYQDEGNQYWLDISINCDKQNPTTLNRASGNDPDGEPDYELDEPFEIVNPLNDKEKRMATFRFEYMLLSRLTDEADAFFGHTGDEEQDKWDCRYHNERNIWARNIKEQIDKIKELWLKFPDDLKPEWCTWEQIQEYNNKLKDYESKTEIKKQ